MHRHGPSSPSVRWVIVKNLTLSLDSHPKELLCFMGPENHLSYSILPERCWM